MLHCRCAVFAGVAKGGDGAVRFKQHVCNCYVFLVAKNAAEKGLAAVVSCFCCAVEFAAVWEQRSRRCMWVGVLLCVLACWCGFLVTYADAW